jgi:hypothetical protein
MVGADFMRGVSMSRAGVDTNEVVASIVIERRRRCRWWRRSRSLAPEDMKSKHLLALHA